MKTIYYNGAVYTGEMPLCQAFAVENGIFTFAGTDEQALAGLGEREVCEGIWDEGEQREGECGQGKGVPGRDVQGESIRTVDLQGRFVCAGFNDSHMHLLNYGSSLQMANLAEHTGTMEEVTACLKHFLKERQLPPGAWLKGRGWNQDYFQGEKCFPNRYDLDLVSTEHPICISRACGHICAVNSAALRLAGITRDTVQPEGGRIDTDESGEPLGILRENAMDLVFGKMPAPTVQEIKEMILAASRALNRYGITSCQTDDFLALGNVSWREVMTAYLELEKEGELSVRVNEQSQFTCLQELKQFVEEGYCTGWGSGRFRIGPLKMLGDGSLGARTAYLSKPYSDDQSTRGIPVFTRAQFGEMIGYARNHGMQAAIHAIGDGILDQVLGVYEEVLRENPRADHRHGVVHCQITRPDQLEKFKELDLHAYVQSIFLDYDIHIVEERVGKGRAASSYNFKTLMDLGVTVSNGSDCPVEQPDVMAGIQCAVTRLTLDGSMGPYLPDQAMTVREAIDSFTKAGAWASFEEEKKGAVRPGMIADFVVLEKNPFETPLDELAGIGVREVFVGGECVHR